MIALLVIYHLPALLREEQVDNQPEPVMVPAGDRGIHFSHSGKKFVINGKEKKILSGAIHYFRVPPLYWMDRLTKLKAAGLNTVET